MALTGCAALSMSSEVPEGLDAALGYRRPKGWDVVVLRDGEKLVGSVQSRTFKLRSAPGALTLRATKVAGMDLVSAAHGLATVITVDKGKLTGFLETDEFDLTLRSGPKVEIRRERVAKILFGRREGELAEIEPSQFILLRSGDFFGGRLLADDLVLKTSFGQLDIAYELTELIRFDHGNKLAQVVLLAGDVLEGTIEVEDMAIDLDIGERIEVCKEDIAVVYCREGYRPKFADSVRLPVRRAAAPAVAAKKPAEGETPPDDEAKQGDTAGEKAATEAEAPEDDTARAEETPQEKAKDEAPAAVAADVSTAIPRLPSREIHAKVDADIDFEACPQAVGAFYEGVTFSDAWYAWVPRNADFRMHGKAAAADADATMTFMTAIAELAGFMMSPESETRIIGKDGSGRIVAETTVYGLDKKFSLQADAATITTVVIDGAPRQWVLDDLSF